MVVLSFYFYPCGSSASSQVLSSVSDRVLIQSREEEYLMLCAGLLFPRDVRDLPLHAGDDFRDFFFNENVIF